MSYKNLDKRILIAWRIYRLISLLILSAVVVIPLFALSDIEFFQSYKLYYYVAAAVLIAYKLVGLYIYPEIEYRQWGYSITDDRVEISHGIFFIKTTVVPIVRIQHITVSSGPIIRKLGISVVNIHTASGVFGIQGIPEEEAKAIAEMLRLKLYTRLDAQEG